MAEVIQFLPLLVEKHIKEIDLLLKKGELKKAQDYVEKLPVNIKVKINVVLKKRYVGPTK